MKQLTDQEIHEIEKRAEGRYGSKTLKSHMQRACYSAGSAAERLKAKVLVEALEEIDSHCSDGSWFSKRITKALTTYNTKNSNQ